MSPPDDVAVAPSLPLELPEFEGVLPVGVVTKINGSGQRIRRPMHLGERVVLVVEAEVDNIGHARTDDGVKRNQTLKVADLYELEGKPGAVLLRSLRQAYKLADDHSAGRKVLGAGIDQPEPNGTGMEFTVDENGIVLTDAELAAIRGEVLPGLPHVDVAVLVFDDESRALWPDDFADAAGPHPEAGERIRKPGAKAKDDPVLIRSVLDADTGETLESWSEEDEAARLLEEQRAAELEEARLDREAHEELLAAREGVLGPPTPDEDPVVLAEPTLEDVARALIEDVDSKARAVGSIRSDLADVTSPALVSAALELERAGRNRKGVVSALDLRLSDLTTGSTS